MRDEPPCLVVAVAPADDAGRQRMRSLAQQLGVPLVDEEFADDECLRLAWTGVRLELRTPEMKPGRGVCADFSALKLPQGSRSHVLSRRQPIVRAFGTKVRTIADATAGLGQDACQLAALGYEVTAIERSSVLAALLADGLHRAVIDPDRTWLLDDRLRMVVGDARDVLTALSPPPDAIYVDPMYPPKRRRSALPPKDIQVIRALVGDNPDASELCRLARQVASRVVVKRPHHAPPLDGKPDFTIESKLVRYDVYQRT